MVTEDTGIIKAKSFLNQLHVEMARTGFSELYVDQLTHDIVAITRCCIALASMEDAMEG